jgi:hypothetical protein
MAILDGSADLWNRGLVCVRAGLQQKILTFIMKISIPLYNLLRAYACAVSVVTAMTLHFSCDLHPNLCRS